MAGRARRHEPGAGPARSEQLPAGAGLRPLARLVTLAREEPHRGRPGSTCAVGAAVPSTTRLRRPGRAAPTGSSWSASTSWTTSIPPPEPHPPSSSWPPRSRAGNRRGAATSSPACTAATTSATSSASSPGRPAGSPTPGTWWPTSTSPVRSPDGRQLTRRVAAALRRSGFEVDPGRRRVGLTVRRRVTLPFTHLGGRPDVGPDHTGQPAVGSHHRPPERPTGRARPAVALGVGGAGELI